MRMSDERFDSEIASVNEYQQKHSTCDIQAHPWQGVYGAGFSAGWSKAEQACMARLRAELEAAATRESALERVVDDADLLACMVAIGIRPATDCGEGCEHPACHIIRALRRYRKVSAALSGAPAAGGAGEDAHAD